MVTNYVQYDSAIKATQTKITYDHSAQGVMDMTQQNENMKKKKGWRENGNISGGCKRKNTPKFGNKFRLQKENDRP